MLAGLSRIAEVMFARIAPGFLNLVSIVLVGRYLEAGAYGVFSLTVATVGLIVTVMTGPIRFSIIPRWATYEAQGRGSDFERSALSILLLSSVVLGCLGFTLWLLGAISPGWFALAVASSLFAGWAPILQARLQFWRYGFVEITKSIVTILVIYLFVSESPTTSSAIWAFVLGNAFGFLIGWMLCGAPLPSRFERADLKAMLGIGSSFTLSSLAESGLYLGTRYIILWLGSAEFLGIFTYTIDLAQRSVGVVINIITFAVLPRAYKISASQGTNELMIYLRRAGLTGAVISVAVFTLIFLLGYFSWLDLLLGRPLSVLVFTAVSAAVITNRLKKMIVDPIAVALKAHLSIPLAYFLVAPLSIGISAWVAAEGYESLITYIYPASYMCVACLTAAFAYYTSRASQ